MGPDTRTHCCIFYINVKSVVVSRFCGVYPCFETVVSFLNRQYDAGTVAAGVDLSACILGYYSEYAWRSYRLQTAGFCLTSECQPSFVNAAVFAAVQYRQYPTFRQYDRICRRLVRVHRHTYRIGVWKKQSLVLGRSPYQWQHEPCLFGWKKNGKHQWYSDRKQTTIWEFDKPKKNGDHPTMKPIPLIA